MSLNFKNSFSLAGLVIACFTTLVALYTMYTGLVAMPATHRITISLLCFIPVFTITAFNLRAGIIISIFALPLLPNITLQIQAFTGYGRILPQQFAGIDIVAGLFLGSLLNRIKNREVNKCMIEMPWQAGLLLCFITFSSWLAITRNLHQSGSVWDYSILKFNLAHIRSLGWHHDYHPLTDWVIYGNAFTFIALLLPTLKSLPERNEVIFNPLCYGVIVGAVIGIIQSQTGRGLLPHQVFFRNDNIGYIALGFQPDIHAFAGHMLIGAIGLTGYFLYSKSRITLTSIVLLVMPLAWIGLILSKSKASLSLALLCLFCISLIWIFRHSKCLNTALSTIVVAGILFTLSLYFFEDFLIQKFIEIIKNFGISDLNAMNQYMAYRPEIFIAGLRMFSEFPLMGLGQGNFYRLSENLGFSHSSFLSAHVNGENAHNYFLQILAENGIVGMFLFFWLVAYPIMHIKQKNLLIPALVGLLSIGLGNIYSHSLMVRENLLIAASLLALLYACYQSESEYVHQVQIFHQKKIKVFQFIYLIILILIVLLSIKEVYQSFKRFPFSTNNECYKNQPLSEDGWTSGVYELRLPSEIQGVTLNLKGMPPDIEKKPLKMVMYITHDTQGTMATKDILLTNSSPISLDLRLPQNLHAIGDHFKFKIKLDHCFTEPKVNSKEGDKPKGIQIDSIIMQR